MSEKTQNKWTSAMPTEPGRYEIRCNETDREAKSVLVYPFKNELWVEDDDVGKYPLDHYHNNLVRLEWRKKTETIHVIPVGNGEPIHTASEKCWCHPLLSKSNCSGGETDGPMDVATHNAKDCREKFERQGLANDNSKWAIVRQEINHDRP